MAGGDRKTADSVLIAALAAGATRAKAAEQARVGVATVYRRLQDAEFCHQIQVARAEMVDQVVGRLAYFSNPAVEKLGRLMLTAKSENVQLGACRTLLECSVTWREREELEARIAALEQAVTEGRLRRVG